jgi:hypothetical protein
VAARSGLGVSFCLGSVGYSGVVPVSFPGGACWIVLSTLSVDACGIVPVSFSVGTGRIVPASFSVCACRVVPASVSVEVLVLSSVQLSARSITSCPMFLRYFSFSLPVDSGAGCGSILLLSGDGGGTGISWSAGSTDSEMVRSGLA